MSERPELIIEKHPNGKLFIELDSLIEWFETMDGPAKQVGKYAAYTLRGMKEKALSKPNRVMSEEEYYARREDLK